MISSHSTLRSRGSILALLACLPAPALAADVTPTVAHLSGSAPKLDLAETAYEPLDTRQAVPSASKGGLLVQYLSDDLSAFPLNPAAATVTLRPSAMGAPINCSFSAAAPILSASNGGQCFFRITGGLGDTVQIYYMGLLTLNQEIRYTINGMQPAVPGHTVFPFDSNTVFAGGRPTPTIARNPARLVMVIDKSGSMDWSAKPAGDPGCGSFYAPAAACRRWNILGSAATQMANVAKAYATPGDQLGVVFFDSVATDTGGMAAMNATTLNAAVGAIGTRSPGGNTSIGAGVERLKAPLVANAAANNNMTLLFTDGEQNTAPFLVSDGSQLLINATQNQPFGTPWVGTAPVKLCTFRLRTDDPAGPGGTTSLQQIADRGCNGLMNAPVTLDAQPADLIAFFLQVLNTTLIGDKIEMIAKTAGVTPGAGTPVALPFHTSAADGAVSLLLNWNATGGNNEGGSPSNLSIEKDGVVWDPIRDPNVELVRGKDHLVMTLRAPFCNAKRACVKSAGDWKLAFDSRTATGSGLGYNLFVLGDNASIATRFAVDQAAPGIGRPLRLTARLTEAGAPVNGLPLGSVYAIVSGPEASLGNILSASRAKPRQTEARDRVSLAGQKAMAMFDGPERRDIFAATDFFGAGKIPLKETSPGSYEATLPAKFEGVYRVTFMVDGKAPANGPFQRTFSTDRYVPVAVDAARTAATMVITPGSPRICRVVRCYSVTLKPIDQRGNLMGPGKGQLFTLNPRLATLNGVTDRLDGSYVLAITLSRMATGLPDLTIGGPGKTVIPLGKGRGPIKPIGKIDTIDKGKTILR
ncbi:MAG: hypothetical protein B7Y45_03080 [Sphingomonas sp. 28-66-16]|nr:MAG: hypothetical protein B7Y45_03080 [Sphingomonas sp. 28-66-16]